MAAGNTYVAIASQTFSGSQTSLTFSSIPATYTDLVLVCTGTASAAPYVQLNADGAANYSKTVMYATGSSTGSSRMARTAGAPNDRRIEIGAGVSADTSLNIFHFMNYSNTTTYKSVVCRANSITSQLNLGIGLWYSTAAISSIVVGNTNSANFTSATTITLYGIAAA